jgi:iron complex transport system ATP-binding protein
MISTKNLKVAYGDNIIIENLSVSIPKGKITALIGPNGCGKSTLLKTFSRINKPLAGEIQIDSEALCSYSHKSLAKTLSMLPQVLVSPEGISVRKLVEYGRAPYVSHWGRLNESDHEIVEQAMLETGIQEMADRPVESLSGGQKQRAWIAMVLAQDTSIVLLDEPTTYLDLSHQVELMHLMRKLNQSGKTVVVVLHDLNQACRYCDHLVVVKEGKLTHQGSPLEIMNETLLEEVFDMKGIIVPDPVSQTPMCVAL